MTTNERRWNSHAPDAAEPTRAQAARAVCWDTLALLACCAVMVAAFLSFVNFGAWVVSLGAR